MLNQSIPQHLPKLNERQMKKEDEDEIMANFLREYGMGKHEGMTEDEIRETIKFKDELVKFFDEYPLIAKHLMLGTEIAMNNANNLEILRSSFNRISRSDKIRVHGEDEEDDQDDEKIIH